MAALQILRHTSWTPDIWVTVTNTSVCDTVCCHSTTDQLAPFYKSHQSTPLTHHSTPLTLHSRPLACHSTPLTHHTTDTSVYTTDTLLYTFDTSLHHSHVNTKTPSEIHINTFTSGNTQIPPEASRNAQLPPKNTDTSVNTQMNTDTYRNIFHKAQTDMEFRYIHITLIKWMWDMEDKWK